MRCPLTPELWQDYQDNGDSQVAKHLASCPVCRAEAGRLEHLREALSALPSHEVPLETAIRMRQLAAAARGKSLSCPEALANLDRLIEGELDPAGSFLIKDHLIQCKPCAAESAKAEALLYALSSLPQLAVPAVIAERIELARLSLWHRLLPKPSPVRIRQIGFAAGIAAGIMLAFISLLLIPKVLRTPDSPNFLPQTIAVIPHKAEVAGVPRVSPGKESISRVSPPTHHPARHRPPTIIAYRSAVKNRENAAVISERDGKILDSSSPSKPAVGTAPTVVSATRAAYSAEHDMAPRMAAYNMVESASMVDNRVLDMYNQ